MDTQSQSTAITNQLPFELKLKRCSRCEESLPLSEFGRNAANDTRGARDGKNILCKLCVRQKMSISRRALREYNTSRKRAGLTPRYVDDVKPMTPRRIAIMLRTLSPIDRVREAIRSGAHTQKEITCVTKLSMDEVCEALAQTLLWTREIRTQIINHKRMYFVNEPGQVIPRKPVRPVTEPQSHGVSSIYSCGGYTG